MRNFHALFVSSLVAASSHVALAQTDITTPYTVSTDGNINSGVWNFLNNGTTTNGSLASDVSYGVTGSETELNFFGESFAEATVNYAIYQAKLGFYDSSSLDLTAAGAGYGLYYANTTFSDQSSAVISTQYALWGGNHTFSDSSTLSVTGERGVNYGTFTFEDNVSVQVSAEYGFVSSTATFKGQSSMTVNAGWGALYDSLSFADDSTLVIGGTYSSMYTTFNAEGNASLSIDAQYGVLYSEFNLSGQSRLSLNAGSAIGDSTLKLSEESAVVLTADNATARDLRFIFDKSDGGSGGLLILDGHSTIIGSLSSVDGGGIIRNGGTNDAVLTLGETSGSSEFGGTIEDGGSGSLGIKKDAGSTITLSGVNTYTGTTSVDAGTLVVANNAALGSVSAGTSVGANGTLALKGDLNIAEPLSISGGRLKNISGTSTVSGPIGLGGSGVAIQLDAGSLTISGAITGPSSVLISASGSGDLTISGALDIAGGTVSKTGTGKLLFNGATTAALGALILRGGETVLDFENMVVPENLLAAGTTVDMYDSTLRVVGKAGAISQQEFSQLKLWQGQNRVSIEPQNGLGTTVVINDFFSVAGATLNFSRPSGATIASSIAAGTFGNITVTDDAGTGLARATGSEIVRLTGQTLLAADSNDAAVDFLTAPTGTSESGTPYLTMDGDFAVNSLTIDTSLATGANVLDLGGHAMQIASYGLLMQGGQDFTILGGQVGVGGGDLYIHTVGDGTLTITGSVSGGSGTLTKAGDGTLVLTGESSYSGASYINGGTLVAMNDAALGASTVVNMGDRTSLVLGGDVDLAVNVEVVSGSGTLRKLAGGNSSIAGSVRSAGDLSIQSDGGSLGMGTVIGKNATFSGAGDFLVGDSAYLQSLKKEGTGTLFLASNLLANDGVTLNGGAIQIGIGGSSGSLDANTVNNGSIVFNRNDAVIHFYGISGTGSVEVMSGKVGLDAANTYEGGTKVSGGTLSVRQNGATGTGSVIVDAGGTLEGNATITGEVLLSGTIAPGLNPGSGPSISTLSADAMTWNGGGTYQWEIVDAVQNTGWDKIDIGGELSIASTEANPFTIALNSFDASGPGVATNFDPYNDFSWTIASAGSVSGFDPANFVLDSSGFYSPVSGGEFALSQNGQSIVLNYIGITRDIVGPYQTSVDGALSGKWDVLNNGDTTHGHVLADTAGSFAANSKTRFFGESYAEITAAGAISQARLEFHDQSEARVSVSGGISGGQLAFYDSSALVATAPGAISGGSLDFYDTTALSLDVAGAVGSSATLRFHDDSHLDLDVAGALNGGTIGFYDNAVLNANVAGASENTNYNFYGNSKLKPVGGSLLGGNQSFYDSSVLDASEASAVSSGYQYFYGNSRLEASVENAITGGYQSFYGNSVLKVAATNAVAGGQHYFYENSAVEIAAADPVSGVMWFYGDSSIRFSGDGSLSNTAIFFYGQAKVLASKENAIAGATLFFYENSTLEASASGSLNGGAQLFYDSSVLEATAANAVSGGAQLFYDGSVLEAKVANAVNGGGQSFSANSILKAEVSNAVSGGTQNFDESAKLVAEAVGAISGGTQRFSGDSELDLSAAGTITGGTQVFQGNKNFDVDFAGAVTGGEQLVSGVALNANATNALSGNTISAVNGGTINVNAENAIDGSIIRLSDSSLALNGHNVTIRGLSNEYWEAGTVSNESGSSVTLTIAPNSGSFAFHGSITETDGVISVVKTGGGTQALHGASSYSGGTTIREGQLYANNNNALGTGLVTVESGGTLGGGSAITNSVILSGALSPGSAPGAVGQLTTGSQTWNGGGSYLWEMGSIWSMDFLQINGSLTLANTESDRFTIYVSSLGGVPDGFNPYEDSWWDIANATDGITGFDAEAFRLDLAGFAVTPVGFFDLVQEGNSLRLVYTHAIHQITSSYVTSVDGGIYSENWDVQNDGLTTHGEIVADQNYAIAGGQIAFRGEAQLRATANGAIQGGSQIFYDDSKLEISASNGVSGNSLQTFNDNSSLEITSDGSLGGGTQTFNDDSKLNVVEGVINGGTQNFHDDSVLTVGENGVLSYGDQNFFDRSKVVFSSTTGLSGNSMSFHDESSFVLDAGHFGDNNQSFVFSDSSTLKFTSRGKFDSGTLIFNGSSSVIADKAEAISGGDITFNDQAKLAASHEDAIVGGHQKFDENSVLEASAAKAINGGTQEFIGDAVLDASAASALYGGTQTFTANAKLKGTAADSIDGGHQYFYGSSSLEASASAIKSGIQDFHESSTLKAAGANSVHGGTQQFFDGASLIASVSNAVTAGEQHFGGNSTLEANAANSLNGGLQLIGENSVLNANVAGSVGAARVVLFDHAKISVNAENGLSGSTNILFNGIGGAGGVLELNGYSTTVGKIETEAGGGLIRNSNAAAALTVNISADRSTYEGLIEDGSAALAIIKDGAGELELKGIGNSYSGGTTVNAGTLIVNNDEGSATGSGNVFVGANGSLAGAGTIEGSVTVRGGLSPGNSPRTLYIGGNLTLLPGSVTTMQLEDIDFETTFDRIIIGGELSYGGTLNIVLENAVNGFFDLFSFGSLGTTSFSAVTVSGSIGQSLFLTKSDHLWTGSIGESEFTFDEISGQFAAVPEASTNLLLALGVGSLLLLLPRRKKK